MYTNVAKPTGTSYTKTSKPGKGFTMSAGMATGLIISPTYAITRNFGSPYIKLEKPVAENLGVNLINSNNWTTGFSWSYGSGIGNFTINSHTGTIVRDENLSNPWSLFYTGYQVNDVLTLVGGNNDCKIKVLTVDGSGHILTFQTIQLGTNYDSKTSYTTTGGQGSGFQLGTDEFITSSLKQQINTITGHTYQINFKFSLLGTAGYLQSLSYLNIYQGTSELNNIIIESYTTNGDKVTLFTATSSDSFIYLNGINATFVTMPITGGMIENFSVREVIKPIAWTNIIKPT
jgi:hypothetical protein